MLSSSIRAFHEVVQCGSIRKASEKLGVAPSSVSRRIAMLEHQIGAPLFDRSATGISLTHAGRMVSEFAGPTIFNYDALCQDLNELRGSRRQLIRICGTTSAAYMEPSATIAAFRGRFDTVSFRLNLLTDDEVAAQIKSGGHDVGLCLRSADPDLEVVARFLEPTVAVMRRDHPLANRSMIRLEEAVEHPLVAPDPQFAIRRDFDAECRASGLKPDIALESSSLLFVKDGIKNGVGIGLMPRRTIQDPSLVGVVIDREVFRANTVDLVVLRGRRLPRLVRLFVQALAEDLSKTARQPVAAVAC